MHRPLAALTLSGTIAAVAQAATYRVDPTHTFVTFEVPHFATSISRGRFDRKEGTVEFDRAARTGKVELTIETASVNTGTPAFDRHLQGKDFFNSAEHPTARFIADRFVFRGDKVAEVRGSLTMLGRTNPVTLKATHFNCYLNPLLKREVCGGDFETTIERSAWGMQWGLEHGFADRLHLLVQVEAVRQE